MIYDSFYEALAMQAAAIETAVPDMPEHRFSLRYRRKKKSLIRAYERSRKKQESFPAAFRKMRLRRKIGIAVLITALALLLLTGGSAFVYYRISGFHGYRQSTHTDISFEGWEGSPDTLYPRYHLTYDLGGWDKEILCDESDKYSEIYRKEDKYIHYTYEMWNRYIEHYPGSDFDEMHPGGETVPGRTLHHTGADGSGRLIWTDGRYWLSLDYSGISYEEAMEIRSSSYAPIYRITYDMSDWETEVVCDDAVMYFASYRKDGKYFDFCIEIKEAYQNTRLNTEGTAIESRNVNGHEAIYFVQPDGVSQYLAYDNGDYIFDFGFNIGYDEALRIIGSIKLI